MDTSKEYILMCEKAVEIQKNIKIINFTDIIVEKNQIDVVKTLTKKVYDEELPESYKKYCVFSEEEREKNNNLLGCNISIMVDNEEKIKLSIDEYEYDNPRMRHFRDSTNLYGSGTTWIILLRQDQLQEIINPHDYDFMITSNGVEFFLTVLTPRKYNLEHLNSMEQLWLAFAMKEKHNKVWNGKEWENK